MQNKVIKKLKKIRSNKVYSSNCLKSKINWQKKKLKFTQMSKDGLLFYKTEYLMKKETKSLIALPQYFQNTVC